MCTYLFVNDIPVLLSISHTFLRPFLLWVKINVNSSCDSVHLITKLSVHSTMWFRSLCRPVRLARRSMLLVFWQIIHHHNPMGMSKKQLWGRYSSLSVISLNTFIKLIMLYASFYLYEKERVVSVLPKQMMLELICMNRLWEAVKLKSIDMKYMNTYFIHS